MSETNEPISNATRHIRRRSIRGRKEDRPEYYRALVIDDNDAVRDTVAKLLAAIGYQASKAEDGLTAMSLLASQNYDLVITDLEMPLLDGYRLCSWLNQESPDTTTIIMTGSRENEIPALMATGLIDRWILKPFGLSELRGVLDELDLPVSRRR